MPSVSKKQHNLMALVANNPKAAKRLGIPKSVGEDFMKADKGKKFAKGGYAAGGCASKADAKKIAKKEVAGHEKSMHKMKKGGIVEKGTGEKYASKAAMMRHEKKESKAEEAKEHGVKKMAFGGSTGKLGAMAAGMKNLAKNVASKQKLPPQAPKRTQGQEEANAAAALSKATSTTKPMFGGAMGALRDAMSKGSGKLGMKKGGCVKKMARGGGIEKKGKTKGKII